MTPLLSFSFLKTPFFTPTSSLCHTRLVSAFLPSTLSRSPYLLVLIHSIPLPTFLSLLPFIYFSFTLSPSLSVSSPLLPPHHFSFASIHCPLCASLYTAAAPSWHSSLCRINGAIICLYHSVLSLTFTQTHTVRPSVTAGPSTELDNWLVYLKYFPLN